MNHFLFTAADFLSRPPGFWAMLGLMLACAVVILLGIDENLVTFFLSVLAIIVTGVVLIQGYRDTAAIHAKLDELVLKSPRAGEVVGLEKKEPEEIAEALTKREREARIVPPRPRRSPKKF